MAAPARDTAFATETVSISKLIVINVAAFFEGCHLKPRGTKLTQERIIELIFLILIT